MRPMTPQSVLLCYAEKIKKSSSAHKMKVPIMCIECSPVVKQVPDPITLVTAPTRAAIFNQCATRFLNHPIPI